MSTFFQVFSKLVKVFFKSRIKFPEKNNKYTVQSIIIIIHAHNLTTILEICACYSHAE